MVLQKLYRAARPRNGLSDEELRIVMTLAEPLHPHRRGQFLEAVLAEASRHVEVGPGLLNRIAREMQKAFIACASFSRVKSPATRRFRCWHPGTGGGKPRMMLHNRANDGHPVSRTRIRAPSLPAQIVPRPSVTQWEEIVCAENPREYYTGKVTAVPTADKPDF
jgi:hypothetical protein